MSRSLFDFDYDPQAVPSGALFVEADEPLLIYPSAKAAEQDLEAIDVEDGVYPAAFGPRGQPYRINVADGLVVVEPTEGADQPEELRALLVRYLTATGRLADPETPLDTLVAAAWEIEANFWNEHDPYGERFGKRIPAWGCLIALAVSTIAPYLAFW